MRRVIPYGCQDVQPEDLDAVVSVLSSSNLTQGPRISMFESAVREKCEAKFALSLNSATSALHAVCVACGLKEGGLLWTSPISFVASANCGLYCSARIDFVDIDARTFNIDPAKLEEKLKNASARNDLPDVLVVVHLQGIPCDMLAIQTLARKYQFRVIEDASHAVGGYYENTPIGASKYSDATIFSFHPVKTITTGEGGMVLTNDAAIAAGVGAFRSHGISRNPEEWSIEEGAWYYEQLSLGMNYRMTDIQAALGLSQWARLDAVMARRYEIIVRYMKDLAELPLHLPRYQVDKRPGAHLFIINLMLDRLNVTRRQVFEALRSQGVGVNVHYIPIHYHPYYRKLGFSKGQFPVAEKFYECALSLPLHNKLTDQDQGYVVSTLKASLGA